jgi:hypothetical protein
MDVLEPGEVASNDDQMHPPVMQDVEVPEWTTWPFDPEGERNGGSFGQESLGHEQGSIMIRHDEARRRIRLSGALGFPAPAGLMGGMISVIHRCIASLHAVAHDAHDLLQRYYSYGTFSGAIAGPYSVAEAQRLPTPLRADTTKLVDKTSHLGVRL